MLEHNLLTFILLCSAASFTLAIFVLKLLYNKKNHLHQILPFIGLAILFIGLIGTAILNYYFLLLMSLTVIMLCEFTQFLIDIINNSFDNFSQSKTISKDDFVLFDSKESEKKHDGISHEIAKIGREFFVNASECLDEEANMDKLLEYINKTMIEKTDSDGGIIMLLDDFEDILNVKTLSGDYPPPYKIEDNIKHKKELVVANLKNARIDINDTIYGSIINSGKAELLENAKKDLRIFENKGEDYLKIGSYIFLPIVIRKSVIGVISLSRNFGNAPFTQNDFDIAKQLSHFANSAINCIFSFNEIHDREQLSKDFDVANELQSKFIAKKMPVIPTLSIGSYFSAAKGICGDYIDVVPSRKDRISFVVADIAGKGMNSFIVMIMLRSIFRLVLNSKQSAARIVEWSNKGISSEKNIEHFASLALINYDSIEKNIQFTTAGTTPVYIYKNLDNEIKKISVLSEPLGVDKNAVYTDIEQHVESGDILFSFTDGLVEAVNEEGIPYSTQKLTELIKKNKFKTGKEIADEIKSDVKAFMGNAKQHDDQSILVIKIQ